MRIWNPSKERSEFAESVVSERLGDMLQRRRNTMVELFPILSRVGVVECAPLAMNAEGMLMGKKGNFSIRFKSNRELPRRRFTIAHEVGHILLAEFQDQSITNCARVKGRSLDCEKLADAIAAEILMPKQELYNLINEIPKGRQGIQKLSRMYCVSPVVAARRILDLPMVVGVLGDCSVTNFNRTSLCTSPNVTKIVTSENELWKKFCRNPKTTGRRIQAAKCEVRVDGNTLGLPCESWMILDEPLKRRFRFFGWRKLEGSNHD